MIEGMIFALAPALVTATSVRSPETDYIILSRNQPVSTEFIDSQTISDLLAGRVTTYQYASSSPTTLNDFISPIKRSFSVTATLRVGGRVVQPPIDVEEIVYLDE